ALLSDELKPCTTNGPVLKLSPNTAQFIPRNWAVAAVAGDDATTTTPTIAVSAATTAINSRRSGRILRDAPEGWPSDDVFCFVNC
ncbi:hypothetical protein AB0C06_32265, partial [Micromonospora inaquosa]|uniref:hypothetical protein n=1 Tax=Micromonospora inaquosa TaxID=2203716 RepID=UPI0033D56E3D